MDLGGSVKKYGAVTNDGGQWEFRGDVLSGGSGADSESTGGIELRTHWITDLRPLRSRAGSRLRLEAQGWGGQGRRLHPSPDSGSWLTQE